MTYLSLVGLGLCTPARRQKSSVCFFCLSITLLNNVCKHDIAIKPFELRNNVRYRWLGEGLQLCTSIQLRFAAVHPCSTLSLCHQVAPPQHDKVKNTVQFGFFHASLVTEYTDSDKIWHVSIDSSMPNLALISKQKPIDYCRIGPNLQLFFCPTGATVFIDPSEIGHSTVHHGHSTISWQIWR